VFGGLCFGRWIRFFGFLFLVAVGLFGVGFGRELADRSRTDRPSGLVRPWFLGCEGQRRIRGLSEEVGRRESSLRR
ncbi:hypothetical protein, partial [Actinomadura bangladeshensis]|uniref:hypothetical protein n=1 Tax=Actinomadura bangladeshensis TaxID=453573 RepID=UPI001A9F9414